MIKIIKEGNRKTKECNNCECYFSYEPEDVEESYSSIDVKGTLKRFVRCPQCGAIIILEET